MTKHKFGGSDAVDAQKKSVEPRKKNQQKLLEKTDTLETIGLKVLDMTAKILKNSEETRKMLEVMSNIDRRIHPTSEEIFR